MRFASALVAFVLIAAACGEDDSLPAGSESRTTVPSVTSTSTTTAPTDDDLATDASTTTTPTTTTTTPPGDPTQAAISLEPVVELDQPIDAVVAPNGEWWIAERTGRILEIDPADGAIGDTVLDIGGETRARGERGLLGLAIDETALYINFTDGSGDTQVEAVLLDDDGRPGERVPLLSIEQPFGNHNGGGLAIGPDGHLYIAVGDGGSADDPLRAGQDPDTLLAKILRIDPTPNDPDSPYLIPADNPFADGGGEPEIFLIGVRNPWRISFDAATDDFWIADVGQNRWEEVTLLLGANGWGRGANLGWNLREGIEEFRGDRPEGNVDPVFVYGHTGDIRGCSITGGEVYRGDAIPDLRGVYLFGDYCTSNLWAISVASGEVVFVDLGIAIPGGELVDFSVDPDGELVALSLSGTIVRLVPS